MSEKAQAAGWIFPVLYAAVAVGLSRLSRWFYWLTVPVTLFWLINAIGIFVIVTQNSAVYGERGVGYVLLSICRGGLPFLALVVYGFYDFRFRPKPVA